MRFCAIPLWITAGSFISHLVSDTHPLTQICRGAQPPASSVQGGCSPPCPPASYASDVDGLYMKEINVTHTLITFSDVDDIWFSLNGRMYKNNSLVTLEDIGENDTALLCMTNLSDCCQSPYAGSVMSDWWFPNGTAVPSANLSGTSDLNWEFYSDRGQMVVCMHRRRGGEDGIYRCEIPDSMNVTQSIYIGVYTASSGE